MKPNMGTVDKTARVIVAIVIASLYFTHIISGVFGIILMILAVVFLITSYISFCPLYVPFGMSTIKEEK